MRARAAKYFSTDTRQPRPQLILPLFVIAGTKVRDPISSMPGTYRLSPDEIVNTARRAAECGIRGIALFPVLTEDVKDKYATESKNPNGLFQSTIRLLKAEVPEIAVVADVAMDPYSSDGHDGLVVGEHIDNDETLRILADMSLSQAHAGADIIAPSDMMDGRVAVIRTTLDANGFNDVGILAYSAKYASGFYGPFRDALDSAPRFGDKKTYQMDPSNSHEAIKEALLDISEGADMVMVKPALPYLDVITRVRGVSSVPVAAYQVSGEYAMIKAAAAAGKIDEKKAIRESLHAIHSAGAAIILTYFALDAAESWE